MMRWDEKAILEKAEEKGIALKLVDAKTLCLNAQAKDSEFREKFGDVVLQRCISYFRGLHVTAFLESKGIAIVNSYNVAHICGNKMLTTLALVKAGIPTPRTMIAFSPEGVSQAVESFGFPSVLKPVTGSWGRLVAPLLDKATAEAIVESRELLNNPLLKIYYVQEMVERPPRDIRTIVVGDRIIASVHRYAAFGDWRTNVARGGKSVPCSLTKESEELILKTARAVGGGILGIDAMEGPNGILIHEVNNTVEFRGAMSTGIADIPNAILNYVQEKAEK